MHVMDRPWYHFYDMIIESQLEVISTEIEIEIIKIKLPELKFEIRNKLRLV